MPELSLSTEFLEWLVPKVRSFELEDAADGAETEIDDHAPGRGAARNPVTDPIQAELIEAIDDLNERQQRELVAMVWTGRAVEEGEDPEPFDALARTAASERVNATSAYLLGMPLLADYLTEGANQLGVELAV